MLSRCGGSDDNRHVTLPCHLAQWPDIKRHLKHMVANNLNCSHKLVSALNDLYVLVHGEDEEEVSQHGVFDGLKTFLRLTATREETVNFFVVSLPCIVQRAVDIEDLQRDDGLTFSRQLQDGDVCLSRALVASIVACSFLCLFPHCKFKRQSKLGAVNFDVFFRQLSSACQCEKLRCVLNYFERIALDPGGPSGTITFRRQVVPPDDLPSIIDWLTCDQPLCPIQVCHNGKIEDAKSHFIKVNFAHANIGGSVLGTGCLQEEINFSMSPELIAAALFMEGMLDNEAIIIHGFETFSRYTGYDKTLQFTGSCFDSAMKDSKGNLENAVCAIDAQHLGRYSDPGKQYSDHLVLRELNKVWVGFLQPWCSGESAHPDSNRESVVTSEEYYSAVEALNDDAAAGNHVSPSTEDEDGTACARCPPTSRHGNGATQHSMRKTPLAAMDTRSCEYVVDSAARSRLVAVSETSEPCTTHVTSDASNATRTPSGGLNRASPMDVNRMMPLDDANLNADVGLCGTSPRSEFSSEFEEYFESMQQQTQPLVVPKENKYSQKQCAPVVQSFVGILVTQSFHDGCQAAVDMLPKVETFSCCQPNNLVKPKAVRPSGCDLSFRCCQGEGRGVNRVARREFGERVDVAEAGDGAVNSNHKDVDVTCAHRANQASVDDVAEFASNLLRNTYDSAVLNMQGRFQSRANQNTVDHAFRDAFRAEVVQRRRRTLSEGVTSVGGRGDGHADTTVLCDSAVPSFFEECLSDEMKVKLMEMVASQQAEMQRASGAGDAQRVFSGGSAQTASGGAVAQRALGNMGAQRQRGDGAAVNTQTAGHWNVPAIRIYSEDASLTDTVDLHNSAMALSDEPRGSVRRSSFDDIHNQRCSCPHCVCSVDGYVDVMIDDVLTETYDAIIENQCDEAKEQLARCTFRSLDGAAEPDLHRFAGRLVHMAVRDAMRLLRRANKHGKRCRHQSQGRASSPRVEATTEHADSRYFEREFSHDLKRLSPRKSSLVPSSVPSNIDVRRCSLDETRSLQLSNHCSSFRDIVLSDFEDELRNSLVRSPNLHLFESDDGGLLLHRTQRRASEPIHSLKRDSITESTPCVVPTVDVTCQNPAATSNEVVLGWLNATNWGGHGHHRAHRPTSPAPSASPLYLYVHDLIKQVFNETYLELFDRDLRLATAPQVKAAAVDESKAVCDTKLFTRLWHGPRAAHCSPPGGIGSNGNMKLLMSSYFPAPAPFHSLNVMATVMSGHITRDAVRAVSTHQRREEPKFLRPIATGNWGCGASRGDPQLKGLLQWAAASRVQVPALHYYSFSNPQMVQFASVCRKIERRGLTVGELLKLVVDYCHRREDSYHDRERTLFDDICRVNNG